MIKKLGLMIGLIFLFFFVGCSGMDFSGNSNGKVQVEKEITSGDGLKMTMSTSSADVFGRSTYKLTLVNTGKNYVPISSEAFKITTAEVDEKRNILLTSESIELFKTKLFENGDISLYNGQKQIVINGTFFVNTNYLVTSQFSVLNGKVEIKYPYKTELNANVGFGIDTDIRKDGRTQAAPVKITSVKILEKQLNQYTLQFEVRDQGVGDEHNAKITSSSFTLSTSPLSCKSYIMRDNSLKEVSEVQLDSKKVVYYECLLTMSKEEISDTFPTTISVTLDYEYTLAQKFSIDVSAIKKNKYS